MYGNNQLSHDEVRGILYQTLHDQLVGRINISDQEDVRCAQAETIIKAKLTELATRKLIQGWSDAEVWTRWVHNIGMTLDYDFKLDGWPYFDTWD